MSGAGQKRKPGMAARPAKGNPSNAGTGGLKKPRKKSSLRDDFLVASDSDDEPAPQPKRSQQHAGGQRDGESDEDPYANETADERRIRLARSYLNRLETEMDAGNGDGSESESSEEDEETKRGITRNTSDKLNLRLQQDALQSEGRLKRLVAHTYTTPIDASSISLLGRTNHSVTCVAVSENSAFAGCKDGDIVRYDMTTGQRLFVMKGMRSSRAARLNLPRSAMASASASVAKAPSFAAFLNKNSEKASGHIGAINAIAVSDDGRLIASGGRDKCVRIWDARTNTQVRALVGHRDAVTALSFRSCGSNVAQYGNTTNTTHTLYSGSLDRTVKLWDCDQLGYIETLFGHQASITSLDSLRHERALSAGGIDRSVRLWKIPEESQLVFQSDPVAMSIETARMLNEQLYVSGSQDGTLALWLQTKKRAAALVRNAHGGNWISSLACLHYSDVLASGSSDGYVRLWQAQTAAAGGNPSSTANALLPLAQVPLTGFVNGLAFAKSGEYLVAGVGQDHRCGRWERIADAQNGLHIIKLPH